RDQESVVVVSAVRVLQHVVAEGYGGVLKRLNAVRVAAGVHIVDGEGAALDDDGAAIVEREDGIRLRGGLRIVNRAVLDDDGAAAIAFDPDPSRVAGKMDRITA